LAAYLPEIEAALQTIGEGPAWLQRRIRTAPFSGRAPVKLMVERDGEGLAGQGAAISQPGGAEAVAAVGAGWRGVRTTGAR
jgi:hypothetical protein